MRPDFLIQVSTQGNRFTPSQKLFWLNLCVECPARRQGMGGNGSTDILSPKMK
jgi:hypothetical protein